MLSDPEKLARYVASLSEFTIYECIDGNYKHMGATVADAVLQANNRYATNVTPRVNRILKEYPNSKTTSSLLRHLTSIPAQTFLNWRGEERSERFIITVCLFKTEGVETEIDLQDWLVHSANLAKLLRIKGIGQKTLDYFKILVGIPTSAIDRHLLKFLALAGIEVAGYHGAQELINATADLLGVNRACFDHSIWQFMSRLDADPDRTRLQCNGYLAPVG